MKFKTELVDIKKRKKKKLQMPHCKAVILLKSFCEQNISFT